MEKNKRKSLTWSMMRMLILGWLLPLLLIAFAMLYFVSSMLSRQIEKAVVSSMDKAVEICGMRLGEIMTASKNASYNTTIRDSYRQYADTGNAQALYNEVTSFLNQQYKYDESMLCTMLFFLDEPERIFFTYNTYRDNNTGLSGYQRVRFFKENLLEEVVGESGELDTGIKLIPEDGHLYMVRNLVNSSFSPYAMIVIELNPGAICGSLDSVWGAVDYQVYVDGEPVFDTCMSPVFETDAVQDFVAGAAGQGGRTASVYAPQGEESCVCRAEKFGDQCIVLVAALDNRNLIDDLYMIRYVFLLVVIFMIPLVLIVFYFFHAKVSRPVRELVKASEEITGGNYGHQTDTGESSREFVYLNQAFNTMSSELKYQFETIYKEELALRDANIMALQSQINPHFLNNTLEIINWEARMCGAENVSGMIEALGTMLGATMNRKQRRFVTLAEEMSYVDAYLYIISQRFGSRFRVCRDIDESLLALEVPILIIQPIVENAVVHGVEANKEGMVAIRISADWDKIIIEVINDGRLSESDRERIDYLLNGEEQDDNEHHVSLGIRNVNRRIRIIYGPECGLTIQSDEENRTVSRIVVKMQHDNNKSQ